MENKKYKTWVIADPHFGHAGAIKWQREDGSFARDFDTVQDMDDHIVNSWNSLVAPEDRVYLLGDLCMNRKAIHTISRCNGRIVLIKGNHDGFKLNDYIPYFDDIRACVVKKGAILTHIPVHPRELGRFGVNIHGHLHTERVLLENGEVDPRYICVSVEQTNFKPVLLNDILDGLEDKNIYGNK